MKSSLEFQHCMFDIDAEFHRGNIHVQIWTKGGDEKLFTFDFSIQDVETVDEDVKMVSTSGGYGYDYKEVPYIIDHYEHGFEYCEEEVIDHIKSNQNKWQSSIN